MAARGLIQRFGTGHVSGHLGPEGTGTDSTGHQVRTVEANAGGVLNDFSHFPVNLVGVPAQLGVFVGRNGSAGFHPAFD